MKTRVTIKINPDWLAERLSDDKLPTDFVKDSASRYELICGIDIILDSGIMPQITYIPSNAVNELIYDLDEEIDTEKFIQYISETFCSEYMLPSDNLVLSYAVIKEFAQENAKGCDSQEEKEADEVKKCLEKIDSLVGAEDFKALMHEVYKIAPQIKRTRTYDVIANQSYVFSINNGYGLTKALSLMAELFEKLGLRKMSREPRIIEVKTKRDPDAKNKDIQFSDVYEELDSGREERVKVLSIDISAWVGKTNTDDFKTFVEVLNKHTNEFIMVFRIPFVDKELSGRVSSSLSDLMYIRELSFPPFSNEEIKECAKRELENHGFTITKGAWEHLFQRIAEEKSDGKFYGINTIRKVVMELLYKKQLKNARLGKNDTQISSKDTALLCEAIDGGLQGGYEMLDALVGGEKIKEQVMEIISQIELARKNDKITPPCVHMRFVGNPGTGKTTVARIVGKILKERGVLRIGNFYEHAGRDFCGRYIGETAPKTLSICRDAYGSVLFIDEAYSLYRSESDEKDYGREALDTLIAEMENHRDDMVIIMAGYTDEMEKLMKGNAGLASRMPYKIEFPNFTREELAGIFMSMVKKSFNYQDGLEELVKEYFDGLTDSFINHKEFANARFVRNLFERTWAKTALRTQLDKLSEPIITRDDFTRATLEKEFSDLNAKRKGKIGF